MNATIDFNDPEVMARLQAFLAAGPVELPDTEEDGNFIGTVLGGAKTAVTAPVAVANKLGHSVKTSATAAIIRRKALRRAKAEDTKILVGLGLHLLARDAEENNKEEVK